MKKIVLGLLSLLLMTGCNSSTKDIRDETISDTFAKLSAGTYQEEISDAIIAESLSQKVIKKIDDVANPQVLYKNIQVDNNTKHEIEEIYENYKGYALQYYQITDETKDGDYHIIIMLVQCLNADLIEENMKEIYSKVDSLKNNQNDLNEYLKDIQDRYEEVFLNGSSQEFLKVYIHKDTPNKISYITEESQTIPE